MALTGWTKKHKITADVSSLSLSGSLTNYPLYLSESAFLSEAFSNSQGKEINSNYLLSDANLVAYWRFESDGTDTSSSGYNLTQSGSPSHATGKFGNGVDLESGSSQYYGIATASAPNLNVTGSSTLSVWVKPESIGSTMEIYQNRNASGQLLRVNADGTVAFITSGLTDTGITSDVKLAAGSWYHVVAKYDGSYIYLIINGVIKKEASTGTQSYSTTGTTIGGGNYGSPGNYFDGIVDDCAVFSRALSDDEVLALYAGGADLRFTTDELGTVEIPHEVVNWDIGASAAEVHVRVPTVSTTTTDIYVHYGNSSAKPYGVEVGASSLRADANLQGYWKLESDGTDSSSNGYTLTQSGSPSHATGLFNNGVDLEKDSSQYYYIADASAANLEISGSQTWSAWVKFESVAAAATIMGKIKTSVGVTHRLYIDASARFNFVLDGLTSTAVTSVGSATAGQWYHVVGRYNGSEISIWANGQKLTANASTGTASDTNADFTIGADFGGAGDTATRFLDGVVDDCAIFNRALTDSEIMELYGSGRAVWGENYEGVWHLNNGGSAARDSSINGYNLIPGTAGVDATGQIGQGVDFENSSSQYLTIASASSANLRISGAQTWSAWGKLESDTTGAVMGIRDVGAGSARMMIYSSVNDDLAMRLDGLTPNEVYSNSNISLDTWYFFAGRYDGSTLAHFTNTTKTSSSVSGSLTAITQDFSIARPGAQAGNYWDGIIDEARVYSGSLSDDWLKTDYYIQNANGTYLTASALFSPKIMFI